MTYGQWKAYAFIRSVNGKKKADEYKHYIRKKYRAKNYKVDINDGWRIVSYTEDGLLKKKFFPYFFTLEEWEEFKNNEWRYINSQYDCTGQLFTFNLDRYTTKNGTWVYHTLLIDI